MGSHIHRKATMYKVVEADKTGIELESPLAKLVWVGHAPHNHVQRQLLELVPVNYLGLIFSWSLSVPSVSPKYVIEALYTSATNGDSSVHSGFRAGYEFRCDNLALFNRVIVLCLINFPIVVGLQCRGSALACSLLKTTNCK
ncbi:hypothetical protein ACCI49_17400 [Microbulbifer epialgicus]|uniref:Uncharacterized protein n=1 Tax=Microbulbifer epialgicus TaxID=393907 RepID=A0ABV4P365_9GAMM